MTFTVQNIEFSAEDLEQLGTKEKFWFIEPGTIPRWLFKYSRANTGEHWSEKTAEQLCQALKIPHVSYELATCHGRPGVISPNIVPDGFRMVMGNEVLHKQSPNEYPVPTSSPEQFVRVKEHTVSRVLACFDSGIQPPLGFKNEMELSSGDFFCGYLMLDALISNQDRHHENWAILIDNNTGNRYLCPSYDHAASLGREMTDTEKQERLTTNDRNRTIRKFVSKARSELFRLKTEKKPMLTVDCFFLAVEKRSLAKTYWLQKLTELTEQQIKSMVANIPNAMITERSREFAIAMIIENQARLLNDERAK